MRSWDDQHRCVPLAPSAPVPSEKNYLGLILPCIPSSEFQNWCNEPGYPGIITYTYKPLGQNMFGYKTMSAYRNTVSGRTRLLFNMFLKMVRPIAFGGLQWIRRLHPKATKRTIGYIFGKFIQNVQIIAGTEITDNAFQDTGNTLDA